MSVHERDIGWDRIMREVEKAEGAAVDVGIPADAGADDGTDLAAVAAFNEFGTPSAPARPFMRGAFDENQHKLSRTQERLWNQVLRGRISTDEALAILGEEHQGEVQDFMTALDTPANAEETIRRKGSSNPLIDERILLRAIRWVKS